MSSTRTLAPRLPRHSPALGAESVQPIPEADTGAHRSTSPIEVAVDPAAEGAIAQNNGYSLASTIESTTAERAPSVSLHERPSESLSKDDAFGAELYAEGKFGVSAGAAPNWSSDVTTDGDLGAFSKARRSRGSQGWHKKPVDNMADRLTEAGERFLARLSALIAEATELRETNRALVAENARLAARLTARTAPRARIPRPRGPRPYMTTMTGKKMGRRATPSEVTGTVVMAVISKLEKPTAGEIAAEITKAGVGVSGRAVRFIAEKAGAKTFRGPDGKQRYVISL